MIIVIAYTAAKLCNASDKGESATMNCSTAEISIEHFTKREEREMFLKIISVKALELILFHGCYKILL